MASGLPALADQFIGKTYLNGDDLKQGPKPLLDSLPPFENKAITFLAGDEPITRLQVQRLTQGGGKNQPPLGAKLDFVDGFDLCHGISLMPLQLEVWHLTRYQATQFYCLVLSRLANPKHQGMQ